jgi:hypothetical protein
MSLLWKGVIGLAVIIPITAVVAGMVAASSVEDPAPRETIVIDDGKVREPRDDRETETRNDDDEDAEDEIDSVGVEPDDLDDGPDADDRADVRTDVRTDDAGDDSTDDRGDRTDDRSRSRDGDD